MFRLKISQIDKDRTVFNDVMDGFGEPEKDHYSDAVFITPRLPVKQVYLDRLQSLLTHGFDLSTPQKAMQILSFNSDMGPLYDQLTDMTPQEYAMLMSYVSGQQQGAFSPSVTQDSRPMVEDMGVNKGQPISGPDGNQMNIHTDMAPPTPPAPYKGSPELVDPGVQTAIKMLVNLKKPYATKNDALASIQQMYSKMPPEQLQQQPGYKELMGMDPHLYEAYALPKILESMGVAPKTSAIVRLPMQRIMVAAADPQTLSDVISALIEDGFDAMHDYSSAMELVKLMPNNPYQGDLMAVPPQNWAALVGMAQRSVPQAAPQQPIKYEAPIVPKEISIKPDEIRPFQPGSITKFEQILPQEIPYEKAVKAQYKTQGKLQLRSMTDGFLDLVNEIRKQGATMVPVKTGEPTPFKIKGASPGSMVTVSGGMFVIRWSKKGEDMSVGRGPDGKKQEGMVVGYDPETRHVMAVLYPYTGTDDIVEWPVDALQESMHDIRRISSEKEAQMSQPMAQPVQTPSGQQIMPGDFIQSNGGASGQVSQIAPDGKLVIQDPNGNKVMKDPTEQFEVIKPENSDAATPAAPAAPSSGTGGPNMLK